MEASAPPGRVRARLWDAPTRVVHWALAALIGFSWWAAENDRMQWHRLSGYSVLGLLVFRLLWGFAGSQSAQFASFVKGPKATLDYARSLGKRAYVATAGHNPLGALSVLAILLALVAQVTTGLFAVDVDGLESGPLSDRVSFDVGREFAEWHERSFTALQMLVVLHVAAVVFYAVSKRIDLVRPMVTGQQIFPADPQLRFAPLWRAALVALVAIAVAWFVAKGLRL